VLSCAVYLFTDTLTGAASIFPDQRTRDAIGCGLAASSHWRGSSRRKPATGVVVQRVKRGQPS
jgi:hypothetical protein